MHDGIGHMAPPEQKPPPGQTPPWQTPHSGQTPPCGQTPHWADTPRADTPAPDTVNERAVRILLESILGLTTVSPMLSTGCLLTQLHKDQKLFRGDIAGHLMLAEASAVFKI